MRRNHDSAPVRNAVHHEATARVEEQFLFAFWNVRQGRADVRGALVVAGICCIGQTLFDLLAGTHLPHWGMAVELAMSEFALQLFVAAMAIACYLALEPAIRRQCPHRLTA